MPPKKIKREPRGSIKKNELDELLPRTAITLLILFAIIAFLISISK
jgi:hypothetical protein